MRETLELQSGWWACVTADDAVRVAREERATSESAPVEGAAELPCRIDLPGGPQYGKRSESDGTGRRLPSPFLTYAKQIEIPDSWDGQTVFLLLDNVRYHVTVEIDGREVAHYVGGLEPHRFDITRFVTPGAAAVLSITVGDAGVSGHRVFDFHNYTGTRLPTCKEIENNLVHPVNYGGADRAVGKVAIEAVPRTRVEWVFANPKVARGELVLSGEILNEDQTQSVRLHCEAIGEDGAKRVLLDREVALEHGESQRFEEIIAWPDAVLWDTDNPHLYQLRTTISQGDGVLDTHEDTFGFREFTINGHSFYLNGKKIHMHGQSGHVSAAHDALSMEAKIQFFRDWKELGHVNHIRLHAHPCDKSWVIAADRAGMLITTETALWTTGFHSFDWAGSEEACYENVRRHFMEALVRRDRNNPSVVIWSLSNEMSPITPRDLDNPKMAAMTRVFERIIAEAEAEDSGRIIQMSSAMDFLGRLKMYNLHYPKNWQAFPDYPHTAYWLDKPFLFPWYGAARDEMPAWSWRKDKPLYFGEFTCVFGATPDNQASIVGDIAFEDADNGSARVQEKLWPLEIAAYRRRDVSGFCAWAAAFSTDKSADVRQWLRRADNVALVEAMRPLAALCHSYRTEYFAGDEIELELSLHNDTRHAHELMFRIEARCGDALAWTERMPAAQYGPAESKAFSCRLKAPLVQQSTPMEIVATLWSDGEVADNWQREIAVYPRAADKSLPSDCAVIDPSGVLSTLAKRRNISGAEFLNGVPSGEALNQYKTLWLNFGDAELRLDDWQSARGELRDWVRQGGCLVLDDAPPGVLTDLPVPLKNGIGYAEGERLEITYAYVAAPHHPVLRGLTDTDFALWGRDYYVARRCWKIPEEGNVHALLVAGTDRDGLTSSPLMEVRDGQGSYLVSSLQIWPKLSESPRSFETLSRLAEYSPSWPQGSAAVSGTPQTLVRLQEVGWQGGNSSPVEALSHDVALIDGALLSDGAAPLVADALRDGETVVLHELSVEQTQNLLTVLGVKADVQSGESNGRAEVLTRAHPCTDGITNNNLYWIIDKSRLAAWTPATLHPRSASARVRPISAEGAALTSQGSLTLWKVGAGTLILDGLCWQSAELDEPERARRYLVGFLTNLGFTLDAGAEKSASFDFETEAERRERGHF